MYQYVYNKIPLKGQVVLPQFLSWGQCKHKYAGGLKGGVTDKICHSGKGVLPMA
jgi:hypothetical protein